MEAPVEDRGGVGAGSVGDRLAVWVFAAFVVVAAPVVLFHLGHARWFFSDDWSFLASGRLGSAKDLFRPHDSHWSTLTFIEYRVFWHLFGLKTYLPYQAVVLVAHLAVAVLLRSFARRAGVRPWIATAMAGAFVLFGPGSDDISWGFQIGFTGALALGLVQLRLTDHTGGFDRRDALGIAAGLLALMCSGVGVTMAIVVGVAVLLRRGWKLAAIETAPLGLAFGVYALIEHPAVESQFGRPAIGTLVHWMVNAQVGTFRALGHYQAVGVGLATLLVVGLGLTWIAPSEPLSLTERSKRLAIPTALLVGGIAFSALTAQGRWEFGLGQAQASRYVYLGAAFTLPGLAVAAEEFVRRRRELLPVVIAFMVVAIPANATHWDRAFNGVYFDRQRRVLLTTPRLPFVDQVPGTVRPLLDPFITPAVNVGFLRRAQQEGRLPIAHGPITRATVDEFRVRLGVAQLSVNGFPRVCHTESRPLRVDLSRGEVLRVVSPVTVSLVDGDLPTPKVSFLPYNGQLLVAELPGLHLRIEPLGSKSFTLCDPP